jgi:hypothetical protein
VLDAYRKSLLQLDLYKKNDHERLYPHVARQPSTAVASALDTGSD